MRHTEHVLIAADKFKGSLTAVEVAGHVTVGLRHVHPTVTVESLSVADGGDGTVAAAVAGGFERREVRVTGPLGTPVTAAYALRGDTAIVEMAEASGLQLLPPRVFAPLTATTHGSGELLLAAIDAGARTVVFGVGGSATNDGGAGMLQALGARLHDADGQAVKPGGGPLSGLASADLSGLDPRLAEVEIILAGDVDNPLIGPSGAFAVYGPQKGAGPQDIDRLDAAMENFVQVLAETVGPHARACAWAPGAGAAGGVGYGALVALNATFRPGIEVLLEVLGFSRALERADVVITGEGSLDAQTLHGKAPAGVAAAARAAGKRVVAVCGRLDIDEASLRATGIEAVYPLTSLEPDPARCVEQAGPLLERVSARLAAEQLRRSG